MWLVGKATSDHVSTTAMKTDSGVEVGREPEAPEIHLLNAPHPIPELQIGMH